MAYRKRSSVLQTMFAALGGVFASLLALIGGWIAWSALVVKHHLPLPPAIEAERRSFVSPFAGQLSYYVAQQAQGRPVVLIHSINAGASAYEMRPLFEQYRSQRPVFALDLPGFGFSERTDRVYSVAMYTQAILDFLATQLDAADGVDLIAFSLSSEFAARAALQRPDLFRSLTLISPTGFSAPDQQNRLQQLQERGTSTRVLATLRFPLWSQAIYDLLASPPSLRYFLQQAFVGEVDPDLLAYDYPATHQPGARFAPFYFLSGQLFSPTIRTEVYEHLTLPALVLYDQNANVSFDMLPDVAARHPNWHAERIVPTLGFPHYEKLPETVAVLDRFWQQAETPGPSDGPARAIRGSAA